MVSWICTKSTKNMFVKIVHPGGHMELHDRPFVAAEVMVRNPRCIVAYPHVFRQPWAIAGTDTMLLLGQKYYVVPINTIRKLQRKSIKYSSQTSINDVQASKTPGNGERGSDISTTCWFFIIKNMKSPCPCLHGEDDRANTTGTNTNSNYTREDTKTSSSNGCSDTKELNGKRNKEMITGSPSRFTSIDHWQPNLDRIVEEY